METNNLKKLTGFILSAMATAIGVYNSADMALNVAAILASVYAIMELIKSYNMFSKNALNVISWVIGPVFAMLAWFVQLGIFQGLSWYVAFGVGFVASISANFVYHSEWLEAMLATFIPWFKKQQDLKRAREVKETHTGV